MILERELSIGLQFKSNVLYKSIASKNIQYDMNYRIYSSITRKILYGILIKN